MRFVQAVSAGNVPIVIKIVIICTLATLVALAVVWVAPLPTPPPVSLPTLIPISPPRTMPPRPPYPVTGRFGTERKLSCRLLEPNQGCVLVEYDIWVP